jgi:ubiquinone/menaquinone biosynthesis C-methylase UbiE
MNRRIEFVKNMYTQAAENWEAHIIPAFRPFAAGVIRTAEPRGDEITLDIGTGTGILARMIAPHVKHVTGIDLVPEMIAAAQAANDVPNADFQVADAHRMSLDDDSFDLVVATFGFNATYPAQLFPEIRRVLKPGGRLAFHEWNDQHPLDTQIIEIFVKYMVEEDEADDDLIDMREMNAAPRPWYNAFQTAEDFHEELQNYGFSHVQVWEDRPVEVVLPVDEFLLYKMGWTPRQRELAAMDEWRRADCLDAIRAFLQDEADADGNLHYDPLLFRVRAS